MLIYVQVNEFIGFIGDVVFFERFVHVERSAQSLPSIRSRMLIQLHVTVQNLIQSLLTADLDNVVVLGDHVNDSQFPRLFGQLADAQPDVFPPGQGEAGGVPLAVRDHGRDVQVTAHRTVPPDEVCGGVDGSLGLYRQE